MKKVVETRTAKIFINEYNILEILPYKNVVIDYEDALDNYLVVKVLTKGKAYAKLIDIRYNVTIEPKAKQFIDSKDVQGKTIARAILINSEVKRVTFNFFAKINSNQIPTKFFITKKVAIEWLNSFQQNKD
jgi:hypothetical protein